MSTRAGEWFRRSGARRAETSPAAMYPLPGRNRAFAILGVASWGTLTVVTALNLPDATWPRVAGALVLVLFALAFLSFADLRRPSEPWKAALRLCVLAGSSAVLAVVAPAGQAYAAAFAICAVAPMALPRIWARAVATFTLAVEFPALFSDHNGIVGTLLILSGALFFFLFSSASVVNRRELAHTKETRQAQARAAVLDERGRIARELHDVLAHTLSGLAVQLEGARLLARRTGADASLVAQLGRSRDLAVSGLDEARRAVGALREDGSLLGPDKLPELVEAYGRGAHLSVQGAPRRLPAAARVALYRTAQEALTNARRHAGAPPVDISVLWAPSKVRLVVADRGGHHDRTPPPGNGLTGMRERAELAGGALQAGPSAEGWTVTLELPA